MQMWIKTPTTWPFHGLDIGVTYYIPGKSAGDLFGMVSSNDPFKGLLVTSNDR